MAAPGISRSASLAWASACVIASLSACGSTTAPRQRPRTHPAPVATSSTATVTAAAVPRRPAKLIAIRGAATRRGLMPWTPLVAVRGVTAAWISRVPAHGLPGHTVTLVQYDQHEVRLVLQAGNEDPGGTGWRYGSEIGPAESRFAVAGFNSAFRASYGAGGFMEFGRVGWHLLRGAASVVIYRDGTADIGTWERTVPAPGRPVAEVRQNLGLLVNHGRAPGTVDWCIKVCWGDPLHEQPIVARSGLGITADGRLVWAAGSLLSVRALADALIGAGAVRAMELDINPAWVAGYAYWHPGHGAAPLPIPLMPDQAAIPGEFLQSYYRDFFSILAR